MLAVIVTRQPRLTALGRVELGIVPPKFPGRGRAAALGGADEVQASKIERRAATGEAARRRGESYPPRYACCLVGRYVRSVNHSASAVRIPTNWAFRCPSILPDCSQHRPIATSWSGVRGLGGSRVDLLALWRASDPAEHPSFIHAGPGRDPARTGPVRGQAGHRRPGPDDRADVRRAAGARALPARGRARRGQDARGGDPGHGRRRHVRPDPVHPGPGAGRHHRHPHLPAVQREVRRRAGPGLRQLPARRRDQPGPGQGAVGAARGDGRAAGLDRRRRPTRCRRRSW